MKRYSCIFSLLFFSLFSTAQVEIIDTDRPGQTISSTTVPKKWIQTEIGYGKQTYRFQPILQDTYFQLPSLLVKYGIGNKLEVRLITEFAYIKEENINVNAIYKGINNLQVGVKYNFLKQKGIIPKSALIAHYSFNGARTIIKGKDSIDGGNVRLAMSNKISEKLVIGYNVGIELKSWDSKRMYLYTFSPRYIMTEKFQAFVEIYGFFWKGRIPQTSVDGGISYCINDNLKIDASGGTRINGGNYLKFYAVGASFRFKTSKE
jgi:Putative MetA-pathway of phenol degradation